LDNSFSSFELWPPNSLSSFSFSMSLLFCFFKFNHENCKLNRISCVESSVGWGIACFWLCEVDKLINVCSLPGVCLWFFSFFFFFCGTGIWTQHLTLALSLEPLWEPCFVLEIHNTHTHTHTHTHTFFLQHRGLNSGPTPWATRPALFCDGFFLSYSVFACCSFKLRSSWSLPPI
jgi:hypothetical protein